MVKGQRTPESIRKLIIDLVEEGLGVTAIATRLRVSKTAVYNGMKSRKQTGRPRKVSARDRRKVIRALQNDGNSTIRRVTR